MRPSILLLATLIAAGCAARIPNARTAEVRIAGNAATEAAIENAAFVKGEATADWHADNQQATITFDSTRTTVDAVLRRIAEAGYDNERYLAPDAAYAALPEAAHYPRSLQQATVAMAEMHDHTMHAEADQTPAIQADADPLAPVFTAYFNLKDALVAGDTQQAMKSASALDGALHNVEITTLPEALQAAFKKASTDLMPALHPFTATKDLAKQRDLFAQLTAPMAELAKVAPQPTPIYLDHCPMYNGGADWLSRDKAIKNPYYGSSMLTCGSVKETIGK
ncbi:MAG: DUF3347 domain-containing protein [Flavobacteriales bacterium]|nr:DUF3347 domain-containing protein [Flavobacteriales bacterium]